MCVSVYTHLYAPGSLLFPNHLKKSLTFLSLTPRDPQVVSSSTVPWQVRASALWAQTTGQSTSPQKSHQARLPVAASR